MRSWQRYIIEPWAPGLKIFASIYAPPGNKCPIMHEGIAAITEIATEIEISYSSLPVTSVKTGMCSSMFASGLKRGNFVDMYARRNRAYQMAKAYAERVEVPWDLIFFGRVDSAYYEPVLRFDEYLSNLLSYREKTNQHGILTPHICDFSGICDRFAVGLPDSMDIYFNIDPDKTAIWVNTSTSKSARTVLSSVQSKNRNVCYSEGILYGWFMMNNITSINAINTVNVTFITLRAECGSVYCELNRHDFHMKACMPWSDMTHIDPVRVPEHNRHPDSHPPADRLADPLARCGVFPNSSMLAKHDSHKLYDLYRDCAHIRRRTSLMA